MEIVTYYGNPLRVAMDACPIGSLYYSHYPVEGLYKVVGYRDYSMPGNSNVAVFGELMVPLSFGYPDDSESGFFMEAIANRKRIPHRNAEGAWVL